jgi:apolipoprotein D and lipocalin family protein
MNKILSLVLVLLSFEIWASNSSPLPTANFVDIEKYVGKWYAISAMPQFFTRNCKAQTAEYAIINAQTVSVLNTCLKGKGQTTIKGQAVVVNAATNAELEVTFNNFFTRLFRVKGDYNIIKLDKDYKYVLVGSRNRKSLWILAREKTMPSDIYNSYVAYAKENEFPVEKLQKSEF